VKLVFFGKEVGSANHCNCYRNYPRSQSDVTRAVMYSQKVGGLPPRGLRGVYITYNIIGGYAKMKKIFYCLMVLAILQVAAVSAWASRADCGDLPNVPPKPAVKVAKDDPAVQNDYDKVVAEDTRPGVVYLALVNGAQPTPNACGLNASNAPAEWMGWGGPLTAENVTIGEGGGTRNEIVIGGVYFERGLGTHGTAVFVYPLTGGDYASFHGYVGMSDEKDPAECGAGGTSDFTFSVDGTEMFKSDVLAGTEGGANVAPVEVAFDIPAGAQELVIEIGDGGDGIGCDHSALGDAKLMSAGVTSVSPHGRLSTTWGEIKSSY